MSNLFSVEAYFAVLMRLSVHKNQSVKSNRCFRTYQHRLWWLSFEMIESQYNEASHQSPAQHLLFVIANGRN